MSFLSEAFPLPTLKLYRELLKLLSVLCTHLSLIVQQPWVHLYCTFVVYILHCMDIFKQIGKKFFLKAFLLQLLRTVQLELQGQKEKTANYLQHLFFSLPNCSLILSLFTNFINLSAWPKTFNLRKVAKTKLCTPKLIWPPLPQKEN